MQTIATIVAGTLLAWSEVEDASTPKRLVLVKPDPPVLEALALSAPPLSLHKLQRKVASIGLGIEKGRSRN